MHNKIIKISFIIFILTSFLLTGCGTSSSTVATGPTKEKAATPPEWFAIKMTDVQTGKTFTINNFAGKVVLIQTMAQWCPTCASQQIEVDKMYKLLGNPNDLISITMDVDLNEDEASLKKYAAFLGFDWYYAVAPLEVARALGNLYSAEYLNPPLSPMLIIDRAGNAHQLDYGVKNAETLRKIVGPYLSK